MANVLFVDVDERRARLAAWAFAPDHAVEVTDSLQAAAERSRQTKVDVVIYNTLLDDSDQPSKILRAMAGGTNEPPRVIAGRRGTWRHPLASTDGRLAGARDAVEVDDRACHARQYRRFAQERPQIFSAPVAEAQPVPGAVRLGDSGLLGAPPHCRRPIAGRAMPLARHGLT